MHILNYVKRNLLQFNKYIIYNLTLSNNKYDIKTFKCHIILQLIQSNIIFFDIILVYNCVLGKYYKSTFEKLASR